MFFIVGMSTFTWILIAYIGLHIGAEHLPVLKGITLDYIVANFNLENNHKLVLRVRDLFLIVGSIALFIEVAKLQPQNHLEQWRLCLGLVWQLVSGGYAIYIWIGATKTQHFLYTYLLEVVPFSFGLAYQGWDFHWDLEV